MLRVFLTFLMTASCAFAADEYLGEELKTSLKPHAYEPNVWGIIFSLILVICLIYLTGIAYQRLVKINPKALGVSVEKDKYDFQVLSSKALGQGKSLHVVEVGDAILVLGSTANNVTLLKELPKEESQKEVIVEEYVKNA